MLITSTKRHIIELKRKQERLHLILIMFKRTRINKEEENNLRHSSPQTVQHLLTGFT